MEETLVSINIVNRETNNLYNKTQKNEPILYYWDGEGDLYDKISLDESFIEKYISKINIDNYLNLDICYFYFNNTFNNENYFSNQIRLNDIVLLENRKYDFTNIINELIDIKIKKLYLICFKQEYNKDLKDIKEKTIDIYNLIIEKYPNKLSIESFVNWIRSDLEKDNKLNNKNINHIINVIKKFFE